MGMNPGGQHRRERPNEEVQGDEGEEHRRSVSSSQRKGAAARTFLPGRHEAAPSLAGAVWGDQAQYRRMALMVAHGNEVTLNHSEVNYRCRRLSP